MSDSARTICSTPTPTTSTVAAIPQAAREHRSTVYCASVAARRCTRFACYPVDLHGGTHWGTHILWIGSGVAGFDAPMTAVACVCSRQIRLSRFAAEWLDTLGLPRLHRTGKPHSIESPEAIEEIHPTLAAQLRSAARLMPQHAQ
jgi:hypothetical protein